MDFDSRGSKLEREADARRAAAKAKLAAEQAAARRQREREAELRALEERRKAEEAVKRTEAEALARAEFVLTAGISWSERGLTPFLLESSEDDKVTLPESALQALMQVDAFNKGVLMFRITANSRTSHCGVREFSAPAGKIGLPIKVVESLLGEHQPSISSEDVPTRLGAIDIKFVRLPKAQFAKLQPLHNLFNSVSAVKEVLEQNLRYHATLTENDLVTIWFRGTAHVLRVVEVRATPAVASGAGGAATNVAEEDEDNPFAASKGCSLVDTDVEIDLDVSLEYQQAQAQAQTVFAPTTSAPQQQAQVQPAPASAPSSSAPVEVVDREAMRQKRLEAMARRGAGGGGGSGGGGGGGGV